MQTIDSKLKSRIYGHGRGSVFTPNDFLDLGGRDAVDKALSRMTTRGEVRRLARGLYEYPREHPELGALSPDIEKVAKALAGKDRLRLQPAGAYATNLLGLSEQVPAKAVFLTDGPTRTGKDRKTGNPIASDYATQHGCRRDFEWIVNASVSTSGPPTYYGQRMAHLKRTLPTKERNQSLKDLSLAPTWMHRLFRELAESGS